MLLLLAETTRLPLIASSLWAVAVFLALFALGRVMTAARKPGGNAFEQQRRGQLREGSFSYRRFEPLVGELASIQTAMGGKKLENLRTQLRLVPGMLPWEPQEFIAAKQVEALLWSLLVLPLAFRLPWMIVAILVGLLIWGYPELQIKSVKDKAARRMRLLKLRLPFAMDLMALMMEAGATFQEALGTVVRESKDHPLGQELAVVNHETALGRSRKEALWALARRVEDDDLRELVFAVVKGEELGTPLSRILSDQSGQLRTKRSQWAEKAAGEAQVKIVYPGMLIMLACLAIVVSPFLLKLL